MHEFLPKEIFIDERVQNLPVTQRILKKYPGVPSQVVSNLSDIKFSQNHSRAKQKLFLAKFQGPAVKTCQGMGDYVCCQYHTVALVSDCHLECTYCILQDYLKNNPVITIYTNLDDIFSEISEKVTRHPDKTLRIGTGELSDSLALDHITGFSQDILLFANKHPNVILELKTKTDNVANLLGAKHDGNVVVSWSVNPQSYIQKEEHKCSTLAERLKAAELCADEGYPIGFHLDPLLHFENWEMEYKNLIDELAERFSGKNIAWISLGSLRFTPGLKKVVNARFPKSQIMTSELYPSIDGKIRYYRPIREQMYTTLTSYIKDKLKHAPHYLCMETKAVWKNVFGVLPQTNGQLENTLTENFKFAV